MDCAIGREPDMAFLHPECMSKLTELSNISGTVRDFEQLRTETLPLVNSIFRSDSTISWLTGPGARISNPVKLNVPQHFFTPYEEHFHKLNPLDPVNRACFKGSALTMEQVVPYREFRKTEYFNDFIRPQRIRRQMVVYIRVDNQLVSAICTHRTKDSRFDENDRVLGGLVASILAAARKRIELIKEAEQKGGLFRMVLESTDTGYAILNLDGRPLYLNSKAVEICSDLKKEKMENEDLENAESVIPPPVLNDCTAISRSYQNTRPPELDSRLARERVMSFSPYKKCLFKCTFVDQGTAGLGNPVILISVKALPQTPGINGPALKTAFKLTDREAEIVTYIFEGCRNIDIAESLFISEGTVKNHLRNIFDKVHVKTRTALVRRVLSI